MRRSCKGIAGIVLAAALAGCSDTGVQEGTVPFKSTNTEPLNAMKNEMKKAAQAQSNEQKPAESKPAADSKPAESKPATDSKPADAKPVPKLLGD
ncbi:MAG: hypothetical protein ACLQGP_01110 [Isosphaeraceae bacterium]